MCTGHLSDLHLVHKNSPTEPYQIVKVDNKNFYNTTDGGCVPSVETHHVVLLQTKTPADETLLKIHNDLLAMGITILPKNDLSGMHFNAWWFLFSCKHWNGKKNYMDGLLLSFFHLCKKSTFFKTLRFIKTHIHFFQFVSPKENDDRVKWIFPFFLLEWMWSDDVWNYFWNHMKII